MEAGVLCTLQSFARQKGTWQIQTKAFVYSRHQILAMFLPSFFSFFYGGTMGTYLSLHFSVRSRALSSLLVRKLAISLSWYVPVTASY